MTLTLVRNTSIVITICGLLVIEGCSSKDSPTAPPAPKPPPATTGQLSFQSNVKPIFEQYGCLGCHGGTNGLTVATVAQLLQGGNHGPAIIPGDADGSLLVKKISSTPPFGARMPFGGPYLPDSTIQVIKNWINQGAKDN